ncbi:MAG: LysR family transcriptional regulator, partial [Oscillospiraceae bacterium]|nr:LysR family transcriptional regulator [Oscillospiraceae bacterium]
MNYNYLRYFSVLAQVEHYTLAAARLGISQPSLSSAIHNLEDELGGVKLFEKVGRNIRLTEEGRYYQEKVDAALRELYMASRTLQDSRIS